MNGIAEKINAVTGDPANQTKTVKFVLTINADRTAANNLMAMLYPSANSSALTIKANLANGQIKSYTSNLTNAFTTNSAQTVTILTGDILGSSDDAFTVDSWVEPSPTK